MSLRGNTARRWTRCKLVPVCFVGYRLWKNCRVRPTVCKHTTHFITVITPLSARIPVLSTPLTYRELNLIELLLYSMRRERFVPSGSQRFLKEASSRLSRLMAVTYVRRLWRSRGGGCLDVRREEPPDERKALHRPCICLLWAQSREEDKKCGYFVSSVRLLSPVNLTHCCLLSVRGCSCKATCFVCLQDYQCFWFMSQQHCRQFLS